MKWLERAGRSRGPSGPSEHLLIEGLLIKRCELSGESLAHPLGGSLQQHLSLALSRETADQPRRDPSLQHLWLIGVTGPGTDLERLSSSAGHT
ncbi:hypothetical protein GN956_G4140 [Arapaima gigas]